MADPTEDLIGRRSIGRGALGMMVAAGGIPLLPLRTAVAEPVADGPGTLHVAPRIVPLPRTVSPDAQHFLAEGAGRLNAMMAAGGTGMPDAPALDNAAWKKRIAMIDKAFEPTAERMLKSSAAKVEWKTIGGISVAVGTPNVMRNADRARLQIHGGGFAYLGGKYAAGQAAQQGGSAGCTVYSVDYRRPPDFPFPAALDDCIAVYRELLKTYAPRKIAISGESAGGNLSATVSLKIRDLGLPLPGAIGMLTPVTDFTREGDTQQTNFGIDTVLTTSPKPTQGPDSIAALYAPGQDLKQPYLSPLFADFGKGFPPTFLQSGTRDILLSDTVRMHRALAKAGVEAELHVWEAMPHSGFGFFTPEDEEIRQQFLKFVDRYAA
jgi:acetyl esterase/lipase